MFSPNKEAELFRQQLDSISVRWSNVWFISFLTNSAKINRCPQDYALIVCVFADAVRSIPLPTEKTSKQTATETTGGSGMRTEDEDGNNKRIIKICSSHSWIGKELNMES